MATWTLRSVNQQVNQQDATLNSVRHLKLSCIMQTVKHKGFDICRIKGQNIETYSTDKHAFSCQKMVGAAFG